MPQAVFQPPVPAFRPSPHSEGWGNTPETPEKPKKPKKKPKKPKSVWLVPVLAGSGVLLFGGVVLLVLSRRRKRAEAAASIAAAPASDLGASL